MLGTLHAFILAVLASTRRGHHSETIPTYDGMMSHIENPRHSVRTTATLLAALLPLAACGSEGEADTFSGRAADPAGVEAPGQEGQAPPLPKTNTDVSVEDHLARELVAAHFRVTNYSTAREALAPLVERENPAVEDLIRLINIDLANVEFDLAIETLERVRPLAPEHPSVLWAVYRVASLDGEFEEALEVLKKLHDLVPDDFPTQLALANMQSELGEDEAAEANYLALLGERLGVNDSWRRTATYCLFSFLQQRGRVEDAVPYQEQLQAFEEAGIPRLRSEVLERGTFGLIAAPARGEIMSEEAWKKWMGESHRPIDEATFGAALNAALPGCIEIQPVVRDDRWDWVEAQWKGSWIGHEEALEKDATEKLILVMRVESMPVEIMGYGSEGVALARLEEGAWVVDTVAGGAVTAAIALDLDLPAQGGGGVKPQRDGRLDFVVAGAEGLRVLGADGSGGWSPRGPALLEASFPISDLAAVDFDHDGDLDVLAVGSQGVRLLRNDGFGWEGGQFTDATEGSGLPDGQSFTWCLTEDPDADNDVDLILGGPEFLFMGSNGRGGVFTDVTDRLDAASANVLRRGPKPFVADLNGDSWCDLVCGGDVLAGGTGFKWSVRSELRPGIGHPIGGYAFGSPLGQPTPQLASAEPDVGLAAQSWREPKATQWIQPEDSLGSQVLFADVDGDGDADLVEADGANLRCHPVTAAEHAVTISLQGVKDNRRAVGALLELRSGPLYRRLYWGGEPLSIGLGQLESVDILRITWPNGLIQEVLGLADGQYHIRQREGLGGSCPFLYTWDGETYTFISDVLGITPLGLPMAPGVLVPPDHDEFVLIRGDQMKPRDGFYEMQFTEELREVTYLDRIRLEVLDHPVGTEVYPNELFSFPPFPAEHTHTVQAPLPPTAAPDGSGKDWSEALAQVDGDYAVPFEPLFGQFLGLAEPHTLELQFDPERVAGAEKLRLVMTGWFYWTDASVNMAAARHPDVEFLPPLLSVPDGQGGWKPTGPPIGFPAGKLKTMVVDVTEWLNPDDPRVRLTSTLQLYWDSIRLAVDGDDAEVRVTKLEPASAHLWSRGFSEPQAVMGISGMDWFEWDQLAEQPRWNQHPGLYTRLGETLPLVQAVDDQFIIMGSGDALRVRFDASSVPPVPEGYVRDYQVFLDGWAKDRDPNTVEALNVEPLPFHGMSAYPYGPEESFPDDAEHNAWRVKWNTRESKRWVESLVPVSTGPVSTKVEGQW